MRCEPKKPEVLHLQLLDGFLLLAREFHIPTYLNMVALAFDYICPARHFSIPDSCCNKISGEALTKEEVEQVRVLDVKAARGWAQSGWRILGDEDG